MGDTLAYRVYQPIRTIKKWLLDARSSVQEDIKDYLVSEAAILPSRAEANEFYREVHKLRDDVERMQAKVRL